MSRVLSGKIVRCPLCGAVRNDPEAGICRKHPRPVYYDGKICPACVAEREFLALTKDMAAAKRAVYESRRQ